MKFSTKAEYGLRAIVRLDKTGKNPVSLSLIAKEEKISLSYLESLFAKLKKAGLVKADKGVKGGYYLTKPASQISALQVIEALEGSVAPYECATGKICCDCACRVLPVWTKLYKQITKTLHSIKLNQL